MGASSLISRAVVSVLALVTEHRTVFVLIVTSLPVAAGQHWRPRNPKPITAGPGELISRGLLLFSPLL